MEKTTKIPLFRRCVIQNFPFIEEDFDALTDYGLLCKVVEYLNKVIEQTNINSGQVEELSVAFNSLKSYVEHYFDNLDVQEEINNKLDEMAEQGVLADIISQYLNSTAIFAFDSIAAMKASENLIAGSYARTTGYYAANDGGGALYKIRTVTNEDVEDDGFIIAMDDETLVAELIIENSQVNIRQLGAKSQIVNNKDDISTYIQKYLSYLDRVTNRITLFIPSGVWYCSPTTIYRVTGFSIIGDEQFIRRTNGGTLITTLNQNQEYIFSIGTDSGTVLENFVLKNICFSTADFEKSESSDQLVVDTIKNVTDCCVKIHGCEFGDTDNLYFQHINGRALDIASSWEIRYRKVYFRDVDARNSSVVLFAERLDNLTPTVVATGASMFDNVMIEETLGDIFATEYHTEMNEVHFGIINFEDYPMPRSDVTTTEFTNDNIAAFEASNPTHYAVFKIGSSNFDFSSIVIDSIELDVFSYFYSTIDGDNYCYDRVFDLEGGKGNFSVTLNNLIIRGIKKDGRILYSKEDDLNYKSSFVLKNCYMPSSSYHMFKYEVERFPYILHEGRLNFPIDTVGYTLPATAIPAYTIANNRNNTNDFGNIYSDDASLNNAHLCVKLPTTGIGVGFVLTSTDIVLCAKIPNGETAKIAVNIPSGNQQVEELAGTGDFEMYPITLNANFSVGTKVNIGYKTGNTATSCIIDYIVM